MHNLLLVFVEFDRALKLQETAPFLDKNAQWKYFERLGPGPATQATGHRTIISAAKARFNKFIHGLRYTKSLWTI